MKKSFVLVAILLMALVVSAQQQPSQEKSTEWKKEKRMRRTADNDSLARVRHKERQEQIKVRKVGYFTAQLELTTDEAQTFWPLYNEYWEKRDKLFMERHNLMQKIQHDKFDDKKAMQITQRLVVNMQEDANLMREYNDKFSKVLSPQKLLKYYAAEESFKMELINVLRKHDRPQ